MSELVTTNRLPPTKDTEDERSKLKLYNDWLIANQVDYLNPDMKRYREFLLDKYSNRRTVLSHVFNVRRAYRKLLEDNNRDLFYSFIDKKLSPSDQKSLVDEWHLRIQGELKSLGEDIKVTRNRDDNFIRLTKFQAQDYINQFKDEGDSYKQQRNYLAVATLLSTGIRSMELRQLTPADLNHLLDQEPALLIRHGKGDTSRLVPYGSQIKIQKMLIDFCKANKIGDDESIFNFHAGTLERIVKRHSVIIKGEECYLKPHDLRRSYARLCFDSGMLVEAIAQNLGHKDSKTTMLYIGEIEADKRRPPALFIL